MNPNGNINNIQKIYTEKNDLIGTHSAIIEQLGCNVKMNISVRKRIFSF